MSMIDSLSSSWRNSLMDNHKICKFRLVSPVLGHICCSLIQLACIFIILSLQTMLIIGETCAYDTYVGLSAIPILLLAPCSIWLMVWRRNLSALLIAMITHLLATLFATSIIIISILVLLKQTHCSISTFNGYRITLHGSIISIILVLKLAHYSELFLCYRLVCNAVEESIDKDSSFLSSSKRTKLWSIASSETDSDFSV